MSENSSETAGSGGISDNDGSDPDENRCDRSGGDERCENRSDDKPGSDDWSENGGYPRRPRWTPDCPKCGGPVIGVTIAGPMTSMVTPCGCRVPPTSLDI
ncbi:hypothetical protein [Halovivax gelatinilyticus]|uniref:hypothetical protein n=1 Tax=Halovivax gelatinilyticus TaxID=2961597 RepID=UPI0020CA8AA5|nr:hypothetical protein [Halovivax gelatinilyticus]